MRVGVDELWSESIEGSWTKEDELDHVKGKRKKMNQRC